MEEKIHQTADAIHQTIYLSKLESKLMSTAYFHRLHDVYQSSTAYFAFPCNRTKRYEHSCGTMELAGQMCFYSIANANEKVLKSFFSDAEHQIKNLIKSVLRATRIPSYAQNCTTELAKCLNADKNQQDIILDDVFRNSDLISDIALDHEIPRFSTDSENDYRKLSFLYQCVLESVRIVALFHDVGHPPYSHIIEAVLDRLYKECKTDLGQEDNLKQFNSVKAEILADSLSQFYEPTDDNITCVISNPTSVNPHLHERIGIKMLTMAFLDVLEKEFKKIAFSEKSTSQKRVFAVYYLTIAEFCMAILRETNSFFISLHRIVDGTIDADRMDYIVRDTRNSGVDWGKISYKRLLESCKLIQQDKLYFVAYPKKMTDDIDDALITRYKIFSRINYHHKVFKSSAILQRLVYLLSIDYLKKEKSENTLCPDINYLWECLLNSLVLCDSYNLSIIQWNDSTLISHLYCTLVNCKRYNCHYYGLQEDEFNEILYMLEAFLLNKRHFYYVFKRQSDFAPILKNVFDALNPLIEKARNHEIDTLKTDGTNANTLESIRRLDKNTLNAFIKKGNIANIIKILPIDIMPLLDDVLFEYKSNGRILTYLLSENSKWSESGLPNGHDESDDSKNIYLYDSDSKLICYDTSALEKQINQLQNNCLQILAYIVAEGNHETVIKDLCQEIQNRLITAFKASLYNLFPYLQQNS